MKTARLTTTMCAAAALVLASASAPALALELWVGAGASCDYQALQDAIDAVPTDGTNTIIRLADDQAYAGQALTVVDRSIDVTGGFETCGGPDDGERTVIAGNGAAPVIAASQTLGVRGVRLTRVEITGGHGVDGGGISAAGGIYVWLYNTRIAGNTATRGGGVYVDGSVDYAQVSVNYSSEIGADGAPNEAVDGAGVYCDHGGVQLRSARVGDNVASGNGGGIALDGCTLESAGAPGELITLEANAAADGGALHLTGASSVNIGDDGSRTRFAGNDATGAGGALFVAGDSGVGLLATRFESNHANYGGAVYATEDSFVLVQHGEDPAQCVAYPCSALLDNAADSDGAAGFARAGAFLGIFGSVVGGGAAGVDTHVFAATGTDTVLVVADTLVHGAAGRGMLATAGAIASVSYATFAGNAFDIDFELGSGAPTLYLVGLIVADAPATILARADASPTVVSYCNTLHENASVPGDIVDPGFIDAASGNYRLRGDSGSIDQCNLLVRAADGGHDVDPDGNVRPIDLAVPNVDGAYDRGAFELPDRIFADGFE